MNKMGHVAVVVGLIVVVYLLLLVVMPVITGLASTANTTMAASSNLSNYPGAAEGVLVAPWILWFVPAVIGMIFIVVILKRS